MSTAAPLIEGQKSKDETEKEKQETVEEIVQSEQMDLNSVVPTDEVNFNRDLTDRKDIEQIVEKAEENVKNRFPEKRQASLQKARQALADKRARAKADGKNAAQGSPAPDLLVEIRKTIHEKFDQVDKQFADLFKIYSHEQALQTNHDVKPVKPNRVEVEEHPSDIFNYPHQDSATYPNIDSGEPPAPRLIRQSGYEAAPGERIREQTHLKRKFQPAFNHLDFMNQEMRKRQEIDSTMGGRTVQGQPSAILF